MAVGPDPCVHPFLRNVQQVASAIDDATGSRPDLMSTAEKAQALRDLARLEARMSALKLRVLGCADDVAADAGARDAAAWLAHEMLLDRGPVRRDGELADALADRWTGIEAALAAGQVNVAQARVCIGVLDELPDDLDAALAEAVEDQLVVLAQQWPPHELKVLGRKILEAIDPATADLHEARILDQEERRARETTSLRVLKRPGGITRIITDQPDAVANRLLTYLDAYTSPRHQTVTGSEPAVSSPESRGPAHVQRGRALGSLLELLDPRRLPAHGGDATTVIVTIGIDQLRAQLAAATVIGHDVERITAGEARRLACTAALIPAVLGADSEVLDLGRASRLFTRAQHKALRIRDRRCRAEGCDVPAAWTEAHHLDPWARGGLTDLAKGVCLCSFHHHRAHDDSYTCELLPNGDVRFRRRN